MKQQKLKKKTKDAPTLPWDRSFEESKKISDAQVKEHFQKKESEKMDEPVDPSKLKFFIRMCEENKRKFIQKPLMDYERSITKSYQKRKSGSSSSDVPQLEMQPKQSIEPLVVLQKEQQGLLAFLQASKLQPEQITGPLMEEQEYPIAPVVKWTFKEGVPCPSRDRACASNANA